MKKREGIKFLISEKGKKWIKEDKCPNCGLHKSSWKRRTDWRCCSKKCSDKFYKNYGCVTWQSFRIKAFERDNYTCAKCGKRPMQDSNKKGQERKPNPSALIGDHIFPIALGGEEFDLDNVQTLCIDCDKIKTAQDQKDISKQRRKEKQCRIMASPQIP